MLDYNIELISKQQQLERLVDRINGVAAVALDIETVNWWNRHAERIALIQLAFRTANQPKVAIIDALANLDLAALRPPLENAATIKIIHNAAFDATRLAAHLGIATAPISDTMLAARRSGEKQSSLKAQAEQHLNLRLDKSAQQADWSRRRLDSKRIAYAALDAVAALLLYEHQRERRLDGAFLLKTKLAKSEPPPLLPLAEEINQSSAAANNTNDLAYADDDERLLAERREESSSGELTKELTTPTAALLGVIAELPSRYYPEQLAASVGAAERAGLAGWILDRMLGREADVDEAMVKPAIAELCDKELVRVIETRRLQATGQGTTVWQRLKPG